MYQHKNPIGSGELGKIFEFRRFCYHYDYLIVDASIDLPFENGGVEFPKRTLIQTIRSLLK